MISRLFSPLNLVLLGLILAAVACGLAFIPADATLPVHWGLNGQPDGYLPKVPALLSLPGVGLFVLAVFVVVLRFAGPDRAAAGIHVLTAASSAVLLLDFGLTAATVLIGLGYPVGMPQVIAVCLAVLAIVIGNALPKSRPNGYAGIRIYSTLRDEANWRATHRFTGLLMTVFGVLLLIGAVLLPPSWPLFALVVASLLLPVLAGVGFSFAYARRHGQPAL